MTMQSLMLTIDDAPASPELVAAIQELEVEASLEQASMFRLRLGISPTSIGDWTVLEQDPFRPLTPVGVRIQSGSPPPRALINGFVAAQEAHWGEKGDASTLEVTGADATLLMNLEEKISSWPSMPDSGVAEAIFAQYGIAGEVEPTSPDLIDPVGTPMQRGTDIRHLRRLARRNGFDCYIQPEPLSGVDIGHFGPRSLVGVPQAVLNVSMGRQTNVSDFRVRNEMLRPTAVQASGLDTQTKSPGPALAPASLQLPPLGLEPTLTRLSTAPQSRPVGLEALTVPALQTAAQAVVDASSWAVVCEGRVAAPVAILAPGRIITVRGCGRQYTGAYLVTRVHHSIGRDGYTQRFEARRNAVTMTGAELFAEVP